MESMRYLKAKGPYCDGAGWKYFNSLNEFGQLFSGQSFAGGVASQGTTIDMLYRIVPGSRRLAVIFNSQQKDNGEQKLFTWLSVGEALGCSRLHISDPTLNFSDSGLIGCYTTCNEGDFQNDIMSCIDIVIEGSGADEVIFIGSSAGGFPAYYYSQKHKDSSCLLLAPILSFDDYGAKKPVNLFLYEMNSVQDFCSLRKLHPHTSYSWRDMEGTLLNSTVHLLQSRHDSQFWEEQSQPWLRELGFDFDFPPFVVFDKKLDLHYGSWGEGHTPPPVEVIEDACRQIRNAELGTLSELKLSFA